jgi:transcription initiation factor IIF auxiliary subunit
LIANEIDITVKDSVFNPNVPRAASSKVQVRKQGETSYYKVWIYLEGPDLPYIESVTYTLHETFPHPERTVVRSPSNPNCELTIWTWGLFTVKTAIMDKKGFSYLVDHELSYDRELPPNADAYAYEEDEPLSDSRPKLVSAS